MKKIIYITILFAVLTSCSSLKQIHSNYQLQQINTDGLIRKDQNLDTINTVVLKNWQNFYTDPNLQSLIRQGLERNSDLSIAKLRIDEAVASLHAARGALLPTLDIAASGSVSKYGGSDATKTYSVGPEVSWTADIFGKLSNNKKASLTTVEKKRAYAQAVQVDLIAEIAEYYYTLETLDAKMKMTEETVNSWTEYVKTEKALMNAGEADQSNVSQAEASLLSTKVILQQLDQQINETENSLCALIGRTSETIARGMLKETNLPQNISGGIDVKLLVNRPDVREAEASLKNAYYNVNVARAAFYPSLTLSGSAGWTNSSGAGVVNPGQILLEATASLVQPIFNNGQNQANLNIAKAQEEEARISFKQTVLNAGNEVNNALKKWQISRNEIQIENQQIAKLQQTLKATQMKMKYGTVNSLQVIVALQSLLSAQLSILSDKYSELEGYINLYQSLGGGLE